MIETNENTRLIQEVTAQFDAPAFVRRARRVEEAWSSLVGVCEQKRNELLTIPKLRLGVLRAIAGDWANLSGLLTDNDDLRILQDLFELWQPRLRVPVGRSTSTRKLRLALGDVTASFGRFNGKWTDFVGQLDLREINTLRVEYNRFYVLEKECSVRSAAIARKGFRPLAPVTSEDIFRSFPLLCVPR